MVAQSVHLPNGQILSVSPVFGGYTFKSSQLDLHHSAFPPGWTVILQTEDEVEETDERLRRSSKISLYRDPSDESSTKHTITHRFTKPTLQNDSLFLSSISIPSSSDFKMSSSPTRQIALMLWSTLYWYFHKEPPSPHVTTEASSLTPESGRPKANWRIRIKREGILKGRNLMQKLERMGLVASEDSSVGTDTNIKDPAGWNEIFVSRRSFWQIDARIFLFTLSPVNQSPFPSASPFPSRPASPARDGQNSPHTELGGPHSDGVVAGISSPGGPFSSGSHLPTYYPPPPTQFVFTHHIRHPLRPKPPRQGETFYTRYIPSVEQYISFRIPTLSRKPCPQFSPVGVSAPGGLPSHPGAAAAVTLPTLASFAERSCDVDILHKWMNEPRVNAAWGCAGPVYTQQKFLEEGLSITHSFPVIGCWNGKPFGYFEIYWVKEDKLGRLLGGQVGNYARGLHALVGEQEYRGRHRVKIWLDALVHYCWLADPRTETVMMEPRVDNDR
jgi:N5-hydroxyornithine acetyltransferase